MKNINIFRNNMNFMTKEGLAEKLNNLGLV